MGVVARLETLKRCNLQQDLKKPCLELSLKTVSTTITTIDCCCFGVLGLQKNCEASGHVGPGDVELPGRHPHHLSVCMMQQTK